MRLIDAKVLFDKVGKIKPRSEEHYKSIGEFMNLITNSPTIDAVEVVRCKECIFYDPNMICDVTDTVCDNDDYCSYGERRKDGE